MDRDDIYAPDNPTTLLPTPTRGPVLLDGLKPDINNFLWSCLPDSIRLDQMEGIACRIHDIILEAHRQHKDQPSGNKRRISPVGFGVSDPLAEIMGGQTE